MYVFVSVLCVGYGCVCVFVVVIQYPIRIITVMALSQPAFTYSKLTKETLKQDVKYVQS